MKILFDRNVEPKYISAIASIPGVSVEHVDEYLGYSPPPLLERLIEDAQKIHKQRPILQERLATVIQPTVEG